MSLPSPPDTSPQPGAGQIEPAGPESRAAPAGAPASAPRSGLTGRVVVLALLLTPLHAYWIVKTEVVWAFVHATVLSLFFNVLGTLFALVLLNRLAARRAPRLALTPAELVGLYVLLCAATAVFGHDFLQVLSTLLLYPYWQLAGNPAWGSTYLAQIPRWLVVTDPDALKGVWLGNSTLYRAATLRAWALPLAAWLAFTLALVWTMLCAVSLLRRRWTEHERLAFPLVQVPVSLLVHQERLLGSRAFWTAFGLAGGLDLWNALATAWPSIPLINLRADLAPYFTQRPWSEMGWTPLCVYPFAVGLTYFMPLDLAFSAWAFYWVWKAQMVVRGALGMEPLTGAYMGDQSSGAWLGIGLAALWGLRRYLAETVRHAARGDADDGREPMSYRTALLGFAAGAALVVGFALLMGLARWVTLAFFVLLLVFLAAATRMRAEFGPATHDLYFSGPERVMTVVSGTGVYSTRDLAVLSQFHWLTRDYRSSPMPHYLEGYKLGNEAGLRLRTLVLPILLVSAWAFVSWFWCYLHVMYDRGVIVRVAHPGAGWTFLAGESYRRLDGWLAPGSRGPSYPVWSQLGGGLGVTIALLVLRQRFLWFPFHPVGYALAGSWTVSWLWCSVLAGWALKGLLLRYGGVRAYRGAAPFFVGLVMGEFVVGGGLSLYNALTDQVTYGFFP